MRVVGMRFVGMALIAVGLCGCGYTISSRGDGNSGGKTEKLTLATVENLVAPPRPGLEYDLTRRLKDELSADSRFELVGSAGTVLRIQLTEFSEPTLVRDFDNVQTEVALSAVAQVRIVEAGKVRVARVSGRASYAPGAGEGRNVGLDRLWRNLSRNVLDAVGDRDWLAEEKA